VSASTVSPGQTGRSGVQQYVAQVRAALDDLTPDEVEELTGGLEADLTDALGPHADPTDPVDLLGTVDPADVFGEPGAYAAELRSAAGLPPRTSTPAGDGSLRRAAVQGRARIERDLDRLRGLSWWPAVSGFVLSLRPVWWVLRGWVAFQLVEMVFTGAYSGVLPDHLGLLAILLIAVVGSVELGRRTAAGRLGRTWRRAVLLGNVLAVLTLPFAVDHASQLPFTETVGYIEAVPPEDGLWHEGREVRNVLPYDAQGRPLQGVRLFDENGKPLDVGTSARQPIHVETRDGGVQEVTQLPAVDADGTAWWNVYPLRQQARPAPEYAEGEPSPDPSPYRPPTPSVAVPSLVAGLPTPTPTPTAAPTPTPTPTQVTPSPTASPSEKPSPTP